MLNSLLPFFPFPPLQSEVSRIRRTASGGGGKLPPSFTLRARYPFKIHSGCFEFLQNSPILSPFFYLFF